jgi:hypothetical protein
MVEVNLDVYMFSNQKKRSWLVGMQPYLVTAGLGRDKSGVDMGSPGVNRTSVRKAEWHCAVYLGVFNVTSKRHHQLLVATQHYTRDKQKTEAELEKRQTIGRKLRIAPHSFEIPPSDTILLLLLLHTVPRQKSEYSFFPPTPHICTETFDLVLYVLLHLSASGTPNGLFQSQSRPRFIYSESCSGRWAKNDPAAAWRRQAQV